MKQKKTTTKIIVPYEKLGLPLYLEKLNDKDYQLK